SRAGLASVNGRCPSTSDCLEVRCLARIVLRLEPRMTNPRGSHLVLGVALVVGGFALLLIALERQAEQAGPSVQASDVAAPPAATVASAARPPSPREPAAASAQAPA